MKYYAPKNKQLDLGLFRSSLDELDKSNRWIVLGDLLPWTELEKAMRVYACMPRIVTK